ncbi:MAG: hypothetical protein Q8M98_01100 [Candidatus Cloacimonadaceae bacterium]|nr:hypothetical protein [Candidatus Cloacimonadaceae bacterium]MDP3113347.1 hypothetical protein [Candidatus Cloacimonadaceae bacterium]
MTEKPPSQKWAHKIKKGVAVKKSSITHLRYNKEANPERLLDRLSEKLDDKEVLVMLSAFNATLEPSSTSHSRIS